MWNQLKEQAIREKGIRKMLRKDLNIAVSPFFFFVAMIVLVPLDLVPDTKDNNTIIVTFLILFMMGYHFVNETMTYVNENGKNVNLFRKYTNTPVDFKLLIGGKLFLLWKEMLIAAAAYEIPILLIRLAAHLSFTTLYAYYVLLLISFVGLLETFKIFLCYFYRNKSDFTV